MTERDIQGLFLVLHDKAQAIAGVDLPPSEREVIKLLIGSSLKLLESFFVDINRIANALENIAIENRSRNEQV